MGPNKKDEEFKISKVVQVRDAVKTSVKEYFTDPIHYLSYGLLTATMVGLFFGMNFSYHYYVILAAILLVKTYGIWRTENTTPPR